MRVNVACFVLTLRPEGPCFYPKNRVLSHNKHHLSPVSSRVSDQQQLVPLLVGESRDSRQAHHTSSRVFPPRMESPVRSVETGENGSSGGGGGGAANQQDKQPTAAGQAGAGGAAAAETSPSQRFEAKSYLERQVEELSCADEDEAQEKVSQRLQFKQDQAQKKR